MKAVFEKTALLSAITPTLGAVSSKNTIPAIQGILFSCKQDGKCTLTAFDLEKGYRTTLDANVEVEGDYIFEAQKLVQTIRVMPEGFITIEVVENNLTKIYNGKTEFGMHALDGKEFPTLPLLEGDTGFTIKKGLLKSIIGRTQFAISVKTNMPELTGTYFKVENNSITAVSCDGNRVAKIDEPADTDAKEEFIVPGNTLAELAKLLSDNDDIVSVQLTRKHIILFFDNIIYFSRLIEKSFVDYNKFIEHENFTFVKLSCESLIESLERASLVTEDRSMGQTKSGVKLSFADNLLKISSTSVTSRVYDEIYTDQTGDNIDIGFNCRYLLDALRCCNTEKIKISLSNPNWGILIERAEASADGAGFQFIIMPIRMK